MLKSPVETKAQAPRRRGGKRPLRFTLRGYKKPRDVLISALGELEREVMDAAWRQGEVSVRDVHVALGERLAYTTVMTTLGRLHRKGLLARAKDGRAYRYSPRVSREELEQGVLVDVVDGLLRRNVHGRRLLLTHVIRTLGERDRPLLGEVERLIREKRRQLGAGRHPRP